MKTFVRKVRKCALLKNFILIFYNFLFPKNITDLVMAQVSTIERTDALTSKHFTARTERIPGAHLSCH